MSHRGGQDRQFGLRIGALAVPAQQGVDGMGVPYVVKACRTACDADNGGVAQQAAEAAIDPAYGIGAGAVTAVGQQRGVRSVPRGNGNGLRVHTDQVSGTVGTLSDWLTRRAARSGFTRGLQLVRPFDQRATLCCLPAAVRRA